MKLLLQRYSDNGNSTQGLMFLVDGSMVFESYTLEDEIREIKVTGETCIPAGLYEIDWRLVESEKTLAYRKRFNWFKWHMELLNVPNFKYIYIHVGNTEKDTNGCILVQDMANNNQVENGFNGQSTRAFKRLYRMVELALNKGEKVFIEIRDIKELA